MKASKSKRTKGAREIKHILLTQRAVEEATSAVISYLKKTKRPTSEVAHRIIDQVLEAQNCESPEGHIVAGGKESAEPHAIGKGYLKKHTPIVIDIYPRSKKTGYFADMTRTVCLGKPPKRLQQMYETVLKAQTLAISMVRPGVRCTDIQTAVRDFFKQAGYETSGKGKEFAYAEGFVHGVGHGVGLKVHEAPTISPQSTQRLRKGDVITVEPGLYYKDIGGVRIEDMVLVTKNGFRNLSNFPKQFVIRP